MRERERGEVRAEREEGKEGGKEKEGWERGRKEREIVMIVTPLRVNLWPTIQRRETGS